MSELLSEPQQAPEKKIYTISEITRKIKRLLENAIPSIWLEGEISNFKRHSSGHIYFVLKDENSQISCVMWRGRNNGLYFTPQDGMKIQARGNVTVYEKRGNYQFEVLQMQPAGLGELQMALEQLKQSLKAEGLFDEQHKKKIPQYPEKIGIVTSPTGAAIRDLVSVVQRRFPSVQLILNPVRVQGAEAAGEIARAIDEFNAYGDVDVLIVGRGGGSLEDLWAFNEEVVARAIFRSKIPVISAVGHEIDFGISDFVADLRAPTPSAAAELVVRNREELLHTIQYLAQKMFGRITANVNAYREKINYLANSYALRRPSDVIKQYEQRMDELNKALEMNFTHRIEINKRQVESLRKQLESLNPQSILKRGYSICYREQNNEIIRDAAALEIEEGLHIRFYRGRADSVVKKIYSDKDHVS
ncbi:MAG TPA: exodeoxyribonuclease VII large subunit [Bacteroidetes bacterium]|nr:exodeoxyribonuclease 7 large subunit [bacterium BMS3Bbin03]HDK35949.1 exodeoxyribonuclease VII large subunit [Bacteroidota bacterium]